MMKKSKTHGKRRTFFQSWLVGLRKGLHLDADRRSSSMDILLVPAIRMQSASTLPNELLSIVENTSLWVTPTVWEMSVGQRGQALGFNRLQSKSN
ncbi:MAG: hypothetical protein ACLT29_06510 [Ruminococcus callidus]